MKEIGFFKDEESIAEKCFGICDDPDVSTKTEIKANILYAPGGLARGNHGYHSQTRRRSWFHSQPRRG